MENGGSAVVLARLPAISQSDGEVELQRVTELCRRLFEAQEAERRRVACELHDDVGQWLTGLLYSLESEEAHRERLWGEVSGLLAKVRRLSQRLRPGILDDLGLGPALGWLADEHNRDCETAILLELPEAGKRWPPELETELFRIAQEALTNAARHAAAKRMNITVEEQDGEIHMRITDDGIGFDPSERRSPSTGLASMREWALLLGGCFELSSETGIGTWIEVRLPLLGETGP